MRLHRHTLIHMLLLCSIPLLHTACKKRKGKGGKEPQKTAYELPTGKHGTRVPFAMLLREVNPKIARNSYVQVVLTTQKDNVGLDRFFVTAQASPTSRGKLQAKLNSEKKYSLSPHNTSLSMLALYKSDEDSLRQGKPLKINFRYAPDEKTSAGTAIDITITVVQKDAKDAVVQQAIRKITIHTKTQPRTPRKSRTPRKGKKRANTI